MKSAHHMIVKLPGGYTPLVICADPLETDVPQSSGTGKMIYGRGTIDANGEYAFKTGKFIAHAVVPLGTTRFTFDGPLIRHGASWTLMVTRSSDVMIDHAKVLNTLTLGENDAVDIVDSQHVIVKNSIGIAWDDSFSTKAQPQNVGITIKYPGENQVVNNVTFTDNLAWTGCYGFKLGQGVFKAQTNIRFQGGTVFSAAMGLGINHASGDAEVSDISFSGIAIEEVTGEVSGYQAWFLMLVSNGGTGAGPIKNIHLWDIAVYDVGKSAVFKGFNAGAGAISDITMRNIWVKSLIRAANTLSELKIVPTFATGISLYQN